jgi:hypothetical protein
VSRSDGDREGEDQTQVQERIVTDTEIQINGMAHVILCVSDFGAARRFYGRLLPALGLTPVCDSDSSIA